jgi:hypothetical protein
MGRAGQAEIFLHLSQWKEFGKMSKMSKKAIKVVYIRVNQNKV